MDTMRTITILATLALGVLVLCSGGDIGFLG